MAGFPLEPLARPLDAFLPAFFAPLEAVLVALRAVLAGFLAVLAADFAVFRGAWREAVLAGFDFDFAAAFLAGTLIAEPLPWHEQEHSVALTLPPLAVLWLGPEEQAPRH